MEPKEGSAKFRQPSLPSELAGEVERIIHENPWLGYRSLSGFTQVAVRKHLQDTQWQVYQRHIEQASYQVPERLDPDY